MQPSLEMLNFLTRGIDSFLALNIEKIFIYASLNIYLKYAYLFECSNLFIFGDAYHFKIIFELFQAFSNNDNRHVDLPD